MCYNTSKAQSAIEYLMTYGWMLLVVAIVGGAIFAMVGDQSIETVTGFDGQSIAIDEVGMTSEGMSAVVRNQDSDSITINEIKLSDGDNEVIVFPGKSVSVADTDTVRFPVFETDSGTNAIDATINFDSGNLEGMETSGTITGNYFLDENFDPREWRTWQYNAQGTGYHPYTWGPASEPDIEWRVEDGGNYRSNPSLSNGTVYQSVRNETADTGFYVNAYDAETGEEEWSYDMEGTGEEGTGISNYDNLEITDDYVIGYRWNNTLFALDRETGNLEWEEEGQYNAYEDGILYITDGWQGEPSPINREGVGDWPDTITALELDTGNELWSTEIEFEATGQRENVANELEPEEEDGARWPYRDAGIRPTPVIDDEKLYAVGRGNVFALDKENGELEWNTEIEKGVVGRPAVGENGLYITSDSGHDIDEDNTELPEHYESNFWKLDKETGEIEWSHDTGERAWSGPGIYDGKVYAATRNATASPNEVNVNSFDKESGEEEWSRTLDARDAYGAPLITEGTVYQSTQNHDDEDSNLFAFDAYTGETIWEKSVGHNSRSTPTVGEGRLYFNSRDDGHHLYMLE